MRKISIQQRSNRENCKALYLVILLIGLMLLMRDSFGVPINKFIFLVVVGVATFALPIGKVIYLIAFVMPLYVGIPGNYLTLVFLIRFLREIPRVRFNAKAIIFCALAGGWTFIDALMTNNTEIAQLVFFPSMVLVMLIYALRVPYNKNRLVLCYSLGVAALGLIMLISTLQFYDIMDLLTSATRLGDDATRFAEEGVMNVSIDPNFYGMFAIAAISAGVEALGNKGVLSKVERVCMVAAVGTSMVVALIGLSRAFFLVLFVWVVLYTLSRRKAKTLLLFAVVVIVAGMLVYMFMPNVIQAIFDRLGEKNALSGGGRLGMLEEYYADWKANATTILFGTGILDCEMHCTLLQPLFGGGVVYTILFAGFVGSLGQQEKTSEEVSFLQKWLPMIVTVAMSLTVPAFLLINFMYPLILIGQYNVAGCSLKQGSRRTGGFCRPQNAENLATE